MREPSEEAQTPALRPFRLSLYAALAYTLLIAYASLAPFAGWQVPQRPLLAFVLASWPRYVTRGDVLINMAAYLPFGFLVIVSLPRRWPKSVAVVATCLLGVSLSFLMEFGQQFVPGRIASNLDLLTNGAGALLGAALAVPLLRRPAALSTLTGVRDYWFHTGRAADAGLVLVALFFFAQANPSLPWMASRVLEAAVPLEPAAVQGFSFTQLGLSLSNTLTLSMLVSLLTPRPRPRFWLCTLVLVAIALGKLLAAHLLLKPEAVLQWLSVEAALGTAYGLAFAGLVLRLGRTPRAWVGMAGAAASLVFAYAFEHAATASAVLRLFDWRYGHLLNFNGITGFVAELWPVLALGYFALTGAGARRAGGSATASPPPGRPR
jgi:VanZ family protein